MVKESQNICISFLSFNCIHQAISVVHILDEAPLRSCMHELQKEHKIYLGHNRTKQLLEQIIWHSLVRFGDVQSIY